MRIVTYRRISESHRSALTAVLLHRPTIGVLAIAVLLGCVTAVQADWLAGWTYRKPVTMSNANTALSNYQVQVVVTFVAGKMNADFSDIRFTADDETTLLAHYRESYTVSSTATFWVKVPNLPTGDTTIYAYYGNGSAMSASDGDATFEFFDHFDGGSLNLAKWDMLGSVTVGSGQCQIDGSEGARVKSLLGVNTSILLDFSKQFTGDYNFNTFFKEPTSTNWSHGINDKIFSTVDDNSKWRWNLAGGQAQDSQPPADNQFHVYRLIWTASTVAGYDLYRSPTPRWSQQIGDLRYGYYNNGWIMTGQVPQLAQGFQLEFFGGGGGTTTSYLDYVLARKYASPEPTASLGAEQNLQACCLGGGDCEDLNPLDCMTQDGTPQGPGSSCDAEPDGDGDGAKDFCDSCPSDSDKTVPGFCGCDISETDSDGDGTPDCNDQDRMLHFQGKLKDAGGAAVEDQRDLTFRFYDAETDGNLLFTEFHAGVTFTRGLFSLFLGIQTPGGLPDIVVDRSNSWVSVSVEPGPELSPRSRVPAKPFATKAHAAETLVRPGTLNPAVTVDGDGQVGLGTAAPAEALHVVGNILATGSITPGCSRSLKDDIDDLNLDEAAAALDALRPVKFRYKAETGGELHLGFIAEDVPDLVSTAQRRGVDSMDIVAVLTRMLQEQQAVIRKQQTYIVEQQRLLDGHEARLRVLETTKRE